MKTSKPMTCGQLEELMAVAVRMQRDAEVDRNFPSANFAYAVQVAVMELRRTRDIAEALLAENKVLENNVYGDSDLEHARNVLNACSVHGTPSSLIEGSLSKK